MILSKKLLSSSVMVKNFFTKFKPSDQDHHPPVALNEDGIMGATSTQIKYVESTFSKYQV